MLWQSILMSVIFRVQCDHYLCSCLLINQETMQGDLFYCFLHLLSGIHILTPRQGFGVKYCWYLNLFLKLTHTYFRELGHYGSQCKILISVNIGFPQITASRMILHRNFLKFTCSHFRNPFIIITYRAINNFLVQGEMNEMKQVIKMAATGCHFIPMWAITQD